MAKPMKITFVLPYFGLTGGNRVVAIHADLLRKRGHEVLIISQPFRPPSLKKKITSLIPVKSSPTSAGGDMFLKELNISHKILDTRRPVIDDDVPDSDVIIATWWETAYWVASLSKRKGRKFYFAQHHEVHDHLPWQLSRGSYYLPLRKIVVSKWLVEVMAEEYGDHDVDLVLNSVDLVQFHAPPRDRMATPTVGMLYSTVHFKGVDICLDAVEKAKKEIPDLKLIVFGVHETNSKLPLPEGTQVHRNPAQEKIRDIYAACDVWLFGSRNEGFGLPLLEAMACRTPVVASSAGAAPDLIDNGVNGYIVDVEDSDAMASRMVDVLKLSQDDWRKMSDAAFAVAQGYTWDDAADRFEAALVAEASQEHADMLQTGANT